MAGALGAGPLLGEKGRIRKRKAPSQAPSPTPEQPVPALLHSQGRPGGPGPASPKPQPPAAAFPPSSFQASPASLPWWPLAISWVSGSPWPAQGLGLEGALALGVGEGKARRRGVRRIDIHHPGRRERR